MRLVGGDFAIENQEGTRMEVTEFVLMDEAGSLSGCGGRTG